jgi:hypothetical protein
VRIDRLRAALPRFVQRWLSRGLPRSATTHPPTLTKAPVQISRHGGFATRGAVKSVLQHSPGVRRSVRMRAPRADADFFLVLVSP